MSYEIIRSDLSSLEKSIDKLNSIVLLYFGITKDEGDWPSKLHKHNYLEIFFVLGGTGQLRLDNRTYEMTENSIVIVNANTYHLELSNPGEQLEYAFFSIDNLLVEGFAYNQILSPKESPVLVCDDEKVKKLKNEILIALREKGFAYPSKVKNKLILLIMELFENFIATADSLDKNRALDIVKSYIDENYASKITLDELSQKSYISRWHLTRLFKEISGCSPFQYLTDKRLEESKALLKTTDKSIAEIAFAVGFDSQSYFSQIFKRKYKISPLQYRNQNKEYYE